MPNPNNKIATKDRELSKNVFKHGKGYRLTPDQVEHVRRIQGRLRAGSARFATDDEMSALWKKAGLSA
jgi:hypothetical protein